MDSHKKYKKYAVYSNGFVLSGFEIQDVAAKLSERYGIPERKAKLRLLAGKAAKVKSFSNYREADDLVQRLTGFGLNCYVFTNEINDPSDEAGRDAGYGEYSESSTFYTVEHSSSDLDNASTFNRSKQYLGELGIAGLWSLISQKLSSIQFYVLILSVLLLFAIIWWL